MGRRAEPVGTSPEKKQPPITIRRLRSGGSADDGTRRRRAFRVGRNPGHARVRRAGWGATQQFRNFAPALDPVRKRARRVRPVAKPDRAEPSPETEPSPAPARVASDGRLRHRRRRLETTQTPRVSPPPARLGFGRVAVAARAVPSRCRRRRRWRLPDAAEASRAARARGAGPTQTGPATGPRILAALARANAEETQTRLGCHRARLFQPGEPFPLRCASAVRVRSPKNKLAGPVARGDAAPPRCPRCRSHPRRADGPTWARGRARTGATSCRCAAARGWVGARVEATDGAASALVETAAVESDFSSVAERRASDVQEARGAQARRRVSPGGCPGELGGGTRGRRRARVSSLRAARR